MPLSLREHLTLADILLIILVLVSAGLSAFYLLRGNAESYVHIYKNNLAAGVYPLAEDRIIRIDEHNTLQIEHGKVRMLSADCPDKRCVKQGAGKTLPIICLPNQLVVEIRSASDKRELIIR